MKGELLINGKDAWEEWGVNMGTEFLDTIDSFSSLKEYIQNESRLEHGKRILVELTPKVSSRELSLSFTIQGSDAADYRAKRKAFEAELLMGQVNIQVPSLGSDVYKLVYLGRNISYAMNKSRTFSVMSAKFEEPNPMDRAI